MRTARQWRVFIRQPIKCQGGRDLAFPSRRPKLKTRQGVFPNQTKTYPLPNPIRPFRILTWPRLSWPNRNVSIFISSFVSSSNRVPTGALPVTVGETPSTWSLNIVLTVKKRTNITNYVLPCLYTARRALCRSSVKHLGALYHRFISVVHDVWFLHRAQHYIFHLGYQEKATLLLIRIRSQETSNVDQTFSMLARLTVFWKPCSPTPILIVAPPFRRYAATLPGGARRFLFA